MKRFLLFALLIVLSVGTLVACSGDASKNIGNAQGLEFYLKDDGTYIVEIGSALYLSEIKIPKRYKGRIVSEIGSFSPKDEGPSDKETRLKTVSIPNTVKIISESAFRGCKGLTNVTIGSGVESIGEYAFYGCTNLTNIYIRDIAKWCEIGVGKSFSQAINLYLLDAKEQARLVTDLVIPDGVTSINAYAFYNCESLASVTIPDSVTSIGSSKTFSRAINLYLLDAEEQARLVTNLVMPDGVTSINAYAFYNCISLVSVTIPDSVTDIGNYAFNGCSNLTSVTIPDSVTDIGNYAFNGCSNLTSVTISDNVKRIGNCAFSDCTSLTKINFDATACADFSLDSNVFTNAGRNGTGINVTIGKNVTRIPSYFFYSNSTFSYAPKIVSVMFEEGSACESIDDYAFNGCSNLTSVTIPDNVNRIGNYAFNSCSNLKSVTISDNVKRIGNYAFSDCTSLTKINFNAIACLDFSSNNCVFSNAGRNGTGICITIGKNVTKIPSYLFYPKSTSSYAPKIVSVMFEEGSVCKSIGNSAFHGCRSLTSVMLSNSIKRIGHYAFYGCTSLMSVTIENSVETIYAAVFYGCTELETINYRGTEEEWNAIIKASDWDAGIPSYNIVYNYIGE